MRSTKRKATLDWTRYWTLDEINEWMDSLIANYPTIVTDFSVGTSFEGRNIRGVKVNFGGEADKKTVFFEATIHSNEWIATSTSTFILNELLTSEDLRVRQLAARYEWYFLIVYNVDGYVYTWTTDRLWRKTRKPTRSLLCNGADPNRNWDIHFNEHSTSQNPCSSTYAGDSAFSEPETRQLANFMATVPRLVGYFSFHSLGQFIMIPHGYTRENMENFDVLLEIARKGGAALTAKTQAHYEVGHVTDFFGIEFFLFNKNDFFTEFLQQDSCLEYHSIGLLISLSPT